jgi:hypothetical protein
MAADVMLGKFACLFQVSHSEDTLLALVNSFTRLLTWEYSM